MKKQGIKWVVLFLSILLVWGCKEEPDPTNVENQESCNPKVDPCCGENKELLGEDQQCGEREELQCSAEGCGPTTQSRTVTQFCSGTSPLCDGKKVEGEWTTIEQCKDTQICELDELERPFCSTIYNSEFECECAAFGDFYDTETNLCWQNPSDEIPLNWYEATGTEHYSYNPMREGKLVDYCVDLLKGGYTNWELPTIDDLLSLMRGCDNGERVESAKTQCTMTTLDEDGNVTDDKCVETGQCSDAVDCKACQQNDGFDDDPKGCYWPEGLSGGCESYWSSTEYSNTLYAWYALFYKGYVDPGGKENSRKVRCVRRP